MGFQPSSHLHDKGWGEEDGVGGGGGGGGVARRGRGSREYSVERNTGKEGTLLSKRCSSDDSPWSGRSPKEQRGHQEQDMGCITFLLALCAGTFFILFCSLFSNLWLTSHFSSSQRQK